MCQTLNDILTDIYQVHFICGYILRRSHLINDIFIHWLLRDWVIRLNLTLHRSLRVKYSITYEQNLKLQSFGIMLAEIDNEFRS